MGWGLEPEVTFQRQYLRSHRVYLQHVREHPQVRDGSVTLPRRRGRGRVREAPPSLYYCNTLSRYVSHTLDRILLDVDGKQLMSEALYGP